MKTASLKDLISATHSAQYFKLMYDYIFNCFRMTLSSLCNLTYFQNENLRPLVVLIFITALITV